MVAAGPRTRSRACPRHDLGAQHRDSAGQPRDRSRCGARAGAAGSTGRAAPVAGRRVIRSSPSCSRSFAAEVTPTPAATGRRWSPAGVRAAAACRRAGRSTLRRRPATSSGSSNAPAPLQTPVSGSTSSTRAGGLEVAVQRRDHRADLLVTGHGEERRRAAVGLHADQEEALLGLGELLVAVRGPRRHRSGGPGGSGRPGSARNREPGPGPGGPRTGTRSRDGSR